MKENLAIERDATYNAVQQIAYRATVTAILLVFLGVVVLGVSLFVSKTWEDAGQRGDFVGGHMAAFTGLASFIIVGIAMLLQKEELRMQRLELAESRKVAQDQADALRKQQAELERQNELLRAEHRLNLDREDTDFMLRLASMGLMAGQASYVGVRRAIALAANNPARGLDALSLMMQLPFANDKNYVGTKLREVMGSAKIHDRPYLATTWGAVALWIVSDLPLDWKARYAGRDVSRWNEPTGGAE